VELRLDVATTRGGFVNLHLFVSPEDPQHIEELRRLLSRLQFNVLPQRRPMPARVPSPRHRR
jgi:hypothetical protein